MRTRTARPPLSLTEIARRNSIRIQVTVDATTPGVEGHPVAIARLVSALQEIIRSRLEEAERKEGGRLLAALSGVVDRWLPRGKK